MSFVNVYILLTVSLGRTEVLNIDTVYQFSFSWTVLLVSHRRTSYLTSVKKIIFSSITCRFYIWVIFVCGMRYRSNLFCFVLCMWVSHCSSTIYENPFFRWIAFAFLLKINWSCVCGSFSGLSISLFSMPKSALSWLL